MSVGLLIVSHSSKLAEGICELAAQMAADVTLAAAGGTDDGDIGTSFGKVQSGLDSADTGDGVVILTDLGSAVMTAEAVVDFLDEQERQRVRLAHAPVVEGAVAAAVAAQTGADLDGVCAAAESAFTDTGRNGCGGSGAVPPAPDATPPAPDATAPAGDEDSAEGEFELINPMGLHARPAAVLAQELTDLDTEVTINGVDGKSVMLLMTLGAQAGHTLEVQAAGPQAREAVELIRTHVHEGFGEL